MALLSFRRLNLLSAGCCLILLTIGYYLEYAQGLEPCSLCVLQRGVFLMLAIALLAGGLHNPRRRGVQVYALFTLILAGVGIFLAARQVWLQAQPHAPAEVCMPGISYIFSRLPLGQALLSMLQGSDNCGVVSWRLWGWSIAHWSLLCFILFGLLGISQLLDLSRAKPIAPPK